MRALTIINQKGGVGKSTTAHAVGAGLRLKGFSVLFIDLDAQGNLTYSTGVSDSGKTSFDLLTRSAAAETVIQHTPQGDVIAAGSDLAKADASLTANGKEYRLRDALRPASGKYDYAVIDTPPALGILTVNALTACEWAVIPTQADVFSLRGIAQLSGTIDTVKQYCNPNLRILGIVLTRYSNRAILNREVSEMTERTAAQLGTRLFRTSIRECIALREAQARQQDIFSYSPKSNAAIDYGALVDEIIAGTERSK